MSMVMFSAQASRWLLSAILLPTAVAGGSGLHVAVVVNSLSPDSLALGNEYCERRHVPPQNLVRIAWSGSPTDWSRAEYQAVLADPLAAELARRGLAGQIDFVVLSMAIPYRINDGPDVNSTTAALFYGFKTNAAGNAGGCRLSPVSGHGYYGSELPLEPRPAVTNAPVFLATLLTGHSLAEATAVLERGVASDGTFPTQTVLLQKTSDVLRNVRFYGFDNAVFDAQLNGLRPLVRTNSDATLSLANLAGLETGLAQLQLGDDVFVPGALADSLTSYGGFIFENTGQTTLLEFLRAGATGSYGTVVEPCNYPEKFPNPIAYFYQARGFSLAECYYQSLASPYQGLLVGEPLAAPFARRGQGAWVTIVSPDLAGKRSSAGPALMGRPPAPPVYMGTTNLGLAFVAADASRPLGQVDLFVDGVLAGTVTNLPPTEGNVLHVRINRTVFDHPVPVGATLPTLATNLADLINARSNTTLIAAHPIGDRLELDSLDPATPGADVTINASQFNGTADRLTTFIRTAAPRFLDSTARGWRSYDIHGKAASGDSLTFTITKTNGSQEIVSVTNQMPPLTTVQLTEQLMRRLNETVALQGADGISAEDAFAVGSDEIEFSLYARTPGLPAAQVRVEFKSSPGLVITAEDSPRLDENAADLYPRNHLYLTAGVATLAAAFAFDTTQYADGYHELTAVAYEGSSVRTQTRVSQSIRIQNTPLTAMIEFQLGGSEVAAEAVLPFLVTANQGEIAQIELYGTGDRLSRVANQAAAAFAIQGTDLGPGLHPFYAVVRARDGSSYRTETISVRLIASEAPFRVTISGAPRSLAWPGTPGRLYEVLSGEAVDRVERVEATLTATTAGPLRWPLPEPPATPRYYRVRAPVVAQAENGP